MVICLNILFLTWFFISFMFIGKKTSNPSLKKRSPDTSLQQKNRVSNKFSKKNFCTWLKIGMALKGTQHSVFILAIKIQETWDDEPNELAILEWLVPNLDNVKSGKHPKWYRVISSIVSNKQNKKEEAFKCQVPNQNLSEKLKRVHIPIRGRTS